MEYRRVTFETPGGRLISIIQDDTVDPGDVDYAILHCDTVELAASVKSMAPRSGITLAVADRLIEQGLMKRIG